MAAATTVHPNDLAIGELLAEADPATREVISAYRHDRSHVKNVQAMSSAKFTTDTLEDCAKFLGLKTRDEVNGKIFSNKPTLADRIILKIESHFEAECAACDASYRNKLADKPQKICFRCLQGSHDCDKMKDSSIDLSMPGAVWLCKGCYRQFDALAPTKEKKSKKEECQTTQRVQPTTHEDTGASNGEVEDENGQLASDSPTENGSGPPLNETTRRQICEKYVKNCCPHGISGTRKINGRNCGKDHPRACPRWLRNGSKKYGCTRKKCKLFHPVLCRYSVRTRRCENLACTYVHIANTKRWPASEDVHQPWENTGAGSQESQMPSGNGGIRQYGNETGQQPQQQYQTLKIS